MNEYQDDFQVCGGQYLAPKSIVYSSGHDMNGKKKFSSLHESNLRVDMNLVHGDSPRRTRYKKLTEEDRVDSDQEENDQDGKHIRKKVNEKSKMYSGKQGRSEDASENESDAEETKLFPEKNSETIEYDIRARAEEERGAEEFSQYPTSSTIEKSERIKKTNVYKSLPSSPEETNSDDIHSLKLSENEKIIGFQSSLSAEFIVMKADLKADMQTILHELRISQSTLSSLKESVDIELKSIRDILQSTLQNTVQSKPKYSRQKKSQPLEILRQPVFVFNTQKKDVQSTLNNIAPINDKA